MVVLDAFAGVGGNAVAFALRPEVSLVVCVDTNDERLRLAANNCRVYNIPPEKVVFVHANACDVLNLYRNGAIRIADNSNDTAATAAAAGGGGGIAIEKTRCVSNGYPYGGMELLPANLDAIFLSPPWGGIGYEKVGRRNFELKCIDLNDGTVDGYELLRLAANALPKGRRTGMNLAYFLPRNINGISVARDASKAGFEGCVELEQNVHNDKLKTVTAYIGAHDPNIRSIPIETVCSPTNVEEEKPNNN